VLPRPARPDHTPQGRGSGLVRDAALTIATRFGLAILILATDIILARALGPDAKGRFALVLLYSQLAATVIGVGMDQALAVVAARSIADARRGLANALVWTAVVGGLAAIFSAWLYGVPAAPGEGPLGGILPRLEGGQVVLAAIAVTGELFFLLGLNALLGRGRMASYSLIRLIRRGILLVLALGAAAAANLELDLALALNLVSLALSAAAILVFAWREGIAGGAPSRSLLGEELRFGSVAVVGVIAERLQFRADAFIVNALIGVRATGIYSVTSGLAESLWYVPNALGIVMFSRAVRPGSDASETAAVLTRTTLAVAAAIAIPAFILGPNVVAFAYGPAFVDAGIALRWILPGIVAYSVVAILSRWIVGRGRPGLGAAILGAGLGTNVIANLQLVPAFGINGAAAASSISYVLTAVLTLGVFARLSGRSLRETLLIQTADLSAGRRAVRRLVAWRPGDRAHPLPEPPGREAAAVVIEEHDLGDAP
jgi:O-antigen/teichoic acid export membrane protein